MASATPKCRVKHRCIACPLAFLFLITFIILYQLMMTNELFPSFAPQTTPLLSASCLNSVFDEIFVFSIASRIPTLSITLQQLEQESIVYTLWEGHSDYNTHSNELYHTFLTQQCPNYNESTMDKHVFFLRQTQIDILKYAKQQNSKKILIFEDDIILANPGLIQMFCEIEPFLPKWEVLGIGVNQYRHNEELGDGRIILQNVSAHETKFMKYWDRTRFSYGAFGIGFAAQSYDILLSAFDYETSGVCTDLPIDNLNRYPKFEYASEAMDRIKCINIFPTLVLPDVTDSTHKSGGKRNETYQKEWIRQHTLIENANFFSKYYPLRFPKDNETRQKTLSHDHVMHLLKYGIKTKNQLSLRGKENMLKLYDVYSS